MADFVLTRRRRVAFSTGDITTSAPLALISFFQLYFLTDVVGMGPALASWPILISKLWDAVNDPLVGVTVDALATRGTQRRTLMVVGAPLLSIIFAVMWLVPPLTGGWAVAWFSVLYVLFDTAYTVVHVAYNSLTPALTRDYDEQSRLNGTRMAFSIGGSLAAVIVAALLQGRVADERALFALLGSGVALAVAAPPFVVARVARNVPDLPGGPPHTERSPLGALRTVLATPPFLPIVVSYLLAWSAVSIVAADLIYFARYYLLRPDEANFYILAAQGMALLLIPAVVALARAVGKGSALSLAAVAGVPILLAIAVTPPDRGGVVYLLAGSIGFTIAATYVLPWAMIPDVIAWAEHRHGQRVEATFYAVISFVQKLGTAAAVWAMARVLANAGYRVPASAADTWQPPAAVAAIRWFVGPVPATLLAGATIAAALYPLSREAYRRIVATSGDR